jgi:hypothetical protein
MARIQAAQIRQGLRLDGAGAIGRALEGGIVDDDQLVGYAKNVDLDPRRAEGQCLVNGAQGVLGFVARRAAMTENEQLTRLR